MVHSLVFTSLMKRLHGYVRFTNLCALTKLAKRLWCTDVHPTWLGTQIAQHSFALRHSAVQFLKISSGTRRIFEGHDIAAIYGTVHVPLHLVS